ncbi:hypothetical protein O6H91_10G109800 [Diphasiastrum complanatum]|uniref:Uncharacterized protein n=1 Tax=Diphasiastrum complanatum TaxID=34168 RepID=A0ACC2CLD4_DIPCM|nr:hypothetical protein O6H91_10G109800 [Diphasiastrum complanatum]
MGDAGGATSFVQEERAKEGNYILLRNDSDGNLLELHHHGGIYDKPLPFCGCGIGWFSFVLGFLFPLTWYYGTWLYVASYHKQDLRERPGLGACAIAALGFTVGVIILTIVLLAPKF